MACWTDEKKRHLHFIFLWYFTGKNPTTLNLQFWLNLPQGGFYSGRFRTADKILVWGEKKKSRKNEDFYICVIYWCVLKWLNLYLKQTVLSLNLQLFSFLETFRLLRQNSVCQPDWHLLFCSATLGSNQLSIWNRNGENITEGNYVDPEVWRNPVLTLTESRELHGKCST